MNMGGGGDNKARRRPDNSGEILRIGDAMTVVRRY